MCAAAHAQATQNAPQRVLTAESSPMSAKPSPALGVGHFSEWSRATKRDFLIDWQGGKSSEWTVVLGNEGGDLDSMTAALTWAYHLDHSTQNSSHPRKAIALLQTPTDALDLRPENILALANSQMTPGHSDLMTMNELPEDPETLSLKIQGIVLVDHPAPLPRWDDAKVLSIFDHHVDQGAAPDASPRIFAKTASGTTVVAKQMLDELENLPEEYHLPHELLQLMLSAIAIDSKGLKPKKSTAADVDAAERILRRSDWHGRNLRHMMKKINRPLKAAKKDISHLGVRDLLRRDWKSARIDTPSPHTPTINLGLASIPYSLSNQIEKTDFTALFSWFATHAAWTAESHTDVSVTLNKYKVKTASGEKKKIREIVLVVRHDIRVGGQQADEIFNLLKKTIEENEYFAVQPWERAGELGKRQMAWTHESDAGRKVVMPLLEKALYKHW